MRIVALLIVCALAMLACQRQAAAQSIPTVKGMKPFTAQTHYMSLAGYLRWQYRIQNKTWISIPEAKELVADQK